jgi:hypothetical protein
MKTDHLEQNKIITKLNFRKKNAQKVYFISVIHCYDWFAMFHYINVFRTAWILMTHNEVNWYRAQRLKMLRVVVAKILGHTKRINKK